MFAAINAVDTIFEHVLAAEGPGTKPCADTITIDRPRG
jgi:hypothetical protein